MLSLVPYKIWSKIRCEHRFCGSRDYRKTCIWKRQTTIILSTALRFLKNGRCMICAVRRTDGGVASFVPYNIRSKIRWDHRFCWSRVGVAWIPRARWLRKRCCSRINGTTTERRVNFGISPRVAVPRGPMTSWNSGQPCQRNFLKRACRSIHDAKKRRDDWNEATKSRRHRLWSENFTTNFKLPTAILFNLDSILVWTYVTSQLKFNLYVVGCIHKNLAMRIIEFRMNSKNWNWNLVNDIDSGRRIKWLRIKMHQIQRRHCLTCGRNIGWFVNPVSKFEVQTRHFTITAADTRKSNRKHPICNLIT